MRKDLLAAGTAITFALVMALAGAASAESPHEQAPGKSAEQASGAASSAARIPCRSCQSRRLRAPTRTWRGHRHAHAAGGTFATWCYHIVTVTGGTVTYQLGDNVSATGLGMLEGFDH